jgi:hypothetical protein
VRGGLMAAISVVLIAGCAADPPSVVTATTPTATAPAPPLPAVMDHDDLYEVGVTIPSGKWHTAGPRRLLGPDGSPLPAPPCHWEWRVDLAAEGADATGEAIGPADVEIKPTDRVFKTVGCRPWHLASPIN